MYNQSLQRWIVERLDIERWICTQIRSLDILSETVCIAFIVFMEFLFIHLLWDEFFPTAYSVVIGALGLWSYVRGKLVDTWDDYFVNYTKYKIDERIPSTKIQNTRRAWMGLFLVIFIMDMIAGSFAFHETKLTHQVHQFFWTTMRVIHLLKAVTCIFRVLQYTIVIICEELLRGLLKSENE